MSQSNENQAQTKAPYMIPEVVNYSVQGRVVKALVLTSRDGEVSHLGKNGEPLLTLAFKKFDVTNAPHKRPNVLQTAVATPEIQIEHDVVHASHAFSKQFKEDKGIQTAAQIAAHRGQGEWSEVEDPFGPQLYDAQLEIDRLKKLVADLSSGSGEE